MKNLIIIFFFGLLTGCESSTIAPQKYNIKYSESIVFKKNNKEYEIKFLDVKDKRGILSGAFAVRPYYEAELKLEIKEKDCSGSNCTVIVDLLNYEFSKQFETEEEKVFSDFSMNKEKFSAKAFAFEIGLLKLDPYPTGDYSSGFLTYSFPKKEQYSASLIIK